MIIQQGYELWAAFAGDEPGERLTGPVVAWEVSLEEKHGYLLELRPIVAGRGDVPEDDVSGYYTDNVSALAAVRIAAQRET